MLNIYYESGNDEIALSKLNVKTKAKRDVRDYVMGNHQEKIKTSQTEYIDQVGHLIYLKYISHADARVIIEDLNVQLYFDEEGALTQSWYDVVPSLDY